MKPKLCMTSSKMKLWEVTAVFVIILSECLMLASSSSTNLIFISFLDTATESLEGTSFTLTIEASQTPEVDVDVEISVCYDEGDVTLAGSFPVTVRLSSTSSVSTGTITATSLLAKSQVIDFYISAVTPASATSEEFEISTPSSLRYVIKTLEWTPFFPNDIYPGGNDGGVIEAVASSTFEYYIFLESPRETTASPSDVTVQVVADSGTTTPTCSVSSGETFVTCSIDMTAIVSSSESGVELTLQDASSSDNLVLHSPSLQLDDAFYFIYPMTGQASSAMVHFSQGLKVVKEDAVEVVISIVTEDGFTADGTIELEVFPENPNSYIVSPTTLDITTAQTAASFTVTVIDDTVDEGQYESFRVKISCINGATNTISNYAMNEGLLFVIVDDDIAEVSFEGSDICVTEGDECYDMTLSFDSPAAVSQRGVYRVCSGNGNLVKDDRNIVYSSSYDIPENSCKTNLCICTFDDEVPEETESYYIFPIPPQISAGSSRVFKMNILDDEISTSDSSTIAGIIPSSSGLNEGTGEVMILIQASGLISGLFELKALYGTAELDVDYTISSTTFVSQATSTVTLSIIEDDIYEETECVTLVPGISPVQIGSTVSPVFICWDDTDEGIGVYPENVVGYEGCSIDFVIFSKTFKSSGDIMLSSQIVNGLTGDVSCSLSPSILSNGLGSSTLQCTVATLSTSTDSYFEVEVTAETTSTFISKQRVTFTVKPFETTGEEYHAGQDMLACFETSDTCDVPVCRRITSDLGPAFETEDGTAIAGNDYASSSGAFMLSTGTGTDLPAGLMVSILTDSDIEIVEDFALKFTEIDESVTVLILPDPDVALSDSFPGSISAEGFKFYVLEGDQFYIPALSAFQISLLERNSPINPFGLLGTREITATTDCDFMLSEDSQSSMAFVNILQDDEIEEIEEFVVFVKCNVAFPKTVLFSATICIIDDDKEDKKDEVSTLAYQSTTDQLSTTDVASTTDLQSTTNVPSTTRIESTTNIPSTTREESTTEGGVSTTNMPSTTREESTTEFRSTTNVLSTTRQESTTEFRSTTNMPSTTREESTTELRSTTDMPSTTMEESTTGMPSSTENPSTTFAQSTTNALSTTLAPSTTAIESTTELQSTTFQSSTLEPTTTLMQTTKLDSASTTGLIQTTGMKITIADATTGESQTTDIPTGESQTTDVPTGESQTTDVPTVVSQTTNVPTVVSQTTDVPPITTPVTNEVTTIIAGELSTEITTNTNVCSSISCGTNEHCEVDQNGDPFCSCNDGFFDNGINCNALSGFRINCPEGHFQCSDGACIEDNLKCDGVLDCSDPDDESNCPGACSAVMPPINGFQIVNGLTARTLYPAGMTIMFGSNDGYTLDGSDTLTCQNSDFGQVPECKESCSQSENIDPNAIPSEVLTTFAHGSSISFTCSAGYQGDSVTISCNDGMWEGSFPVCDAVCSSTVCDVNGHCETDDDGNPFCLCNNGFTGTGAECTDVNECEGDHGCVEPLPACINTPGSFSCGNTQITAFSLRRDNFSDYEEDVGYEPELCHRITLPESFYVSVLPKKYLVLSENGVIAFLDEGMDSPSNIHFGNPVNLNVTNDPLVATFWGKFISGELRHRIYTSENSDDKATLMEIGSYVREWDHSDFASNLPFVPTWAIVISWENIKHDDYLLPGNYLQCALTTDGFHTFALLTYQAITWPVAEKLVLGYNSGSEYYEIDQLDDVSFDEQGEQVYHLHEAIGNSNLQGKWVFRLDSNDPSNTNAKQTCINIFTENVDESLPLEHVKACPGYIFSMKGLQFDTCSFTLTSDDNLITYGRPKQSFCLIQKILSTYPDTSPGSYCWYDTDGYLIDTVSHSNVWESTVVQRVHPRSRMFQTASQQVEWIRRDVEFRYQCCVASNSDDHCNLYQSVRPSPSDGTAAAAYAPSGVYGAGHYVTFDGLSYTFNEIGEFILLRMEEATLEVQARSQVYTTALQDAQGTVITRISIKLENNQIEITTGDHDATLKSILNGVEIPSGDLEKGYKASERLSISTGPGVTNDSLEVMDVVLLPAIASDVSVEIFMRVSFVSGSLSCLMTIGESILQRGTTEGLLGVYNGDPSDDFQFPDGHHLFIEDGLTNNEEIPSFGESWRTTQDNSLFSYKSNEGWYTYNEGNYRATFYDDVVSRPDLSLKVARASEMCNDIRECIYDSVILDDDDIALSSKHIYEVFEREGSVNVNYPPHFLNIKEVDGDPTTPGINDNGVLIIKVGRTYKYTIETSDQNENDDVVISLIHGPPGAIIDEEGFLQLTTSSVDDFELLLRLSDGLASTLHKLTVWICSCDSNGECYYQRLWEEDVVRQQTFARSYCLCDDGFIARTCSADVDRCEQNPCYPGVTCIDPGRPEPVQCSDCPSNLVGDGFNCHVGNDCATQSNCEQICVDQPEQFVCTCRSGFELLPDGYRCQDIDECKRKEHLCGDNSICQNSVGSYQCLCRPGYRLVEGTLLCIDINECRNEHSCDVNEVCKNEEGSYHCECQVGFIRINDRCTDINECLSLSLNDCHTRATCSNLIGSYQCTCNEGFEGNGRVCNDRDECRISPFFCHPRFDCQNTDGSYICSCPTGFAGNGDDCFDIDECHLGTFDCAENEDCINRVGYYVCHCKNGYSIDTDGSCVNINECDQLPTPCPTNSECMDNPGSYNCICLAGFFKQDGECLSISAECSSSPSCQDPICIDENCACDEGFVSDESTGKCFDVDECEVNSHDCAVDAHCTNIPGGFICSCNQGYSGNGTQCEDLVECDGSHQCGENTNCQDLPGSYHCVCQEGFEGNGENCVGKQDCEGGGACPVHFTCKEEDPGYSCVCPNGFQVVDENCIDIDECILSPCVESAACYNTDGSFHCSCPYGYFGDGRVAGAGCQDVNECQTGLAACSENSLCENRDGSYNCYCREGFRLQGDVCLDIDECLEGNHDCDGNATCINLPATYTCRCKNGYFNQDIQSQGGYATTGMCKDIDECAMGTFECSENAYCQNEAGGYSCECKDGFVGNGKFCTNANECRNQPCAHLQKRSCLDRIGHYLCICEVGSYEDETGVCVDSNSIELRIEFSDIKGLRTEFAFELIDENVLERLSEDIESLFSRSDVSEYVHEVLVIDMIRSENQMGLVTVRLDFDLKANMTIQIAHRLFEDLLVGRYRNIVPPNSIVNGYSVFYAESNLCLDNRHDCFERGYERCVPEGDGKYDCEGCQFGYRLENGSCLSDPCLTGFNDCSERYFESCQYIGSGEFSCANCQSGFFLTERECVPDPCDTGMRTCDKLNFRQCISDGNNQFHCETCKPGFELQNGACTLTTDDPCISRENTCNERHFQTCVFDGDGEYHCENCLPGYRKESTLCIADPCQVGLNDCRERNFERCRYESGGNYACEKCQAGYELQGSECIPNESSVRRYRGKMRMVAVNDSLALATYNDDLAKTDTPSFKLYEYHICNVIGHLISTQSYLRSQNYNDCFVYQYRSGSIISYFAIDFHQDVRSPDLSIRLEQALVSTGQTTSGGLLLSNKDNSGNILVDIDSIEFLETGAYGCNRNNICTNGGTCIEDSDVYEYLCRCPPNFFGDFCQMVANQQQPITPAAPALVETNEFPAWSIALLGLAAILSFCLCCCCACLYLSTRNGAQTGKGSYRYPSQGIRRPIPVRNRLIQARREGREIPRNALWDTDDGESWRLEALDQRRMQQLSDIISHADFINNRMRILAENRRNNAVYNPKANMQNDEGVEFTLPHLVDGSEAQLVPGVKEYIPLSETLSSSDCRSDGSTTSSESRI